MGGGRFEDAARLLNTIARRVAPSDPRWGALRADPNDPFRELGASIPMQAELANYEVGRFRAAIAAAEAEAGAPIVGKAGDFMAEARDAWRALASSPLPNFTSPSPIACGWEPTATTGSRSCREWRKRRSG